jgi:hypothetical protein
MSFVDSDAGQWATVAAVAHRRVNLGVSVRVRRVTRDRVEGGAAAGIMRYPVPVE